MPPEEKAVRSVSWELAKGVLEQLKPEALRFERRQVERIAFPREAYLGKLDEDLVFAARLLSAAAQSLLTAVEGEETDELFSTPPEKLAETMVRRVQGEILRRKAEVDSQEVGAALAGFFKQQPSAIDLIMALFLSRAEHGCQEGDPLGIMTRSIVKVTDPQGRVSTGFAFCKQGHVLTAEHVVRGCKTVDVAFRYSGNEGKPLETPAQQATVVHADRDRDFAVLQVSRQAWERFQEVGLARPSLSLEWQHRDWVLCLGYQEQEIFADPLSVEAFVKPRDPLLAVRFRDGFEQQCLVLVVPRDHPSVVPGMSGGPVLNLDACKVIAMVTGATREAWVRQRWQGEDVWESISSARYGFATPLSDVRDSWPEFEKCCLKGGLS